MARQHMISSLEGLVGHTIDLGRLRLVKVLGSGSGGVVFLATETQESSQTAKKYAVKCMPKAEIGSQQYACQRQEIEFHQELSSHPHIVTLHHVLYEGPYIFLVLDYYPGGDMFKFLTSRRSYVRNSDLVKSVFVQIIDAVLACHDESISHRDIKPENIMCNEDGSVVALGDLGFATESHMSTHFCVGTSAYMSPECIGFDTEGRIYDTESNDIWALGIIFTSMICGHNPWHRAVSTDECFMSYVKDLDFLRKMLPISESANQILRSIFTSSSRRVSLPELRDMVLEADTFFLTDEEIEKANIHVKLTAASYLGEPWLAAHDDSNSSGALPMGSQQAQRILGQERRRRGEEAIPDLEPSTKIRQRTAFDAESDRIDDVAGGTFHIQKPNPTYYPEKRRPPPPAPMPSFKDLMPSANLPEGHKKSRLPQSQTRFVKRLVARLFPE